MMCRWKRRYCRASLPHRSNISSSGIVKMDLNQAPKLLFVSETSLITDICLGILCLRILTSSSTWFPGNCSLKVWLLQYNILCFHSNSKIIPQFYLSPYTNTLTQESESHLHKWLHCRLFVLSREALGSSPWWHLARFRAIYYRIYCYFRWCHLKEQKKNKLELFYLECYNFTYK